jgi:hypothetical protein
MRQFIKRLILKIAPEAGSAWFNARRNQHIQNFEARIGLTALAESYVKRYGLQVRHGLFSGMKYLPEATGSVFVPKLLGSYESEIYDEIKNLLVNEYDFLVDIGSAEGYYAVGMAFRMPNIKVFSYDSDAHARKLCMDMARLNGVESRVTVGGATTPEELEQRCGAKTLLICDVDGAETLILDPLQVPALKITDMIVEFHDYLDSMITPTLKQRFAATHDLTIITSRDKDPKDYPDLTFLGSEDQQKILGEYRPAIQTWGIFRVKNRS